MKAYRAFSNVAAIAKHVKSTKKRGSARPTLERSLSTEHAARQDETRRPGVRRARLHPRAAVGLPIGSHRPLTIDHRLSRRVIDVVQNVITSVVLPSFRALRPEDIQLKDTPGDPEDLVTIVDKAAERLLVEQLGDVVPGAAFIGEEAVSENPALLSALSSPAPVWLIDPIDGTKNFVRGNADFGVMLALVENG
ncbi:MAG: hypothetical protein EHM55_20465, partial [Acidobacteria bacterium]